MYHIIFWYTGGNSEISPSQVSMLAGRYSSIFILGPTKVCFRSPRQFFCLCNIFGYFHSKFVSVHRVHIFDRNNDSVAFSQHILNPPWKLWLSRNISIHCILGILDRAVVLRVLLKDSVSNPVLPLHKNFSHLCFISFVIVPIYCCDKSISRLG